MNWPSDSPHAVIDPPHPSAERPYSREPVSLFDYWDLIVEHRTLIGGLCLMGMLAALGVSLLLPNVYESTASVLPQLESKDTGALAALLTATASSGMAQTLGLGLTGMPATPTDVFVTILKSRVMADDVITNFNLMDRYREKTMIETRKELDDRVRITVTKEKAIKIAVEDTDAQVAAEMANFYVANLDRLNRTVNVSKAGQNRVFIERRLTETIESMGKARRHSEIFRPRIKRWQWKRNRKS